MIGIFWVYKTTVFGKAVDVAEGEESAPGIVDSPHNHADFWETDKDYMQLFPELRFSEYFDIPRGRVLYCLDKKRAVVYLDKKLLKGKTRQLIQTFFDLKDVETVWRTDPHYTTSPAEIERLLDEMS